MELRGCCRIKQLCTNSEHARGYIVPKKMFQLTRICPLDLRQGGMILSNGGLRAGYVSNESSIGSTSRPLLCPSRDFAGVQRAHICTPTYKTIFTTLSACLGYLHHALLHGEKFYFLFTLPAFMPPSIVSSNQHRLNWVTPMGLTLRTIALTLNGMQIKPAEVFRGKIKFK